MKKNEKKKLHEKGLKELENILAKLEEELVNTKVGKTTRDQKDMHAFLKKRKEIAIIKTIIREKTLGGKK